MITETVISLAILISPNVTEPTECELRENISIHSAEPHEALCIAKALNRNGMKWDDISINATDLVNSIREFQEGSDIPNHGVIDQATREALNITEPESDAAQLGQIVAEAALTQVGVSYRKNTSEPGRGFDCSGLTTWAWQQVGIELPRSSSTQSSSMRHIPREQVLPGDVLWYPGHVGLYIGDNQLIHASQPGVGVVIDTVNWDRYRKVLRPHGVEY